MNVPRRKRRLKEIPIGKVQIMQVPDLATDGRWQTTHILGPGVDHVLQNLPLNVAISPNGCLLCSVSPGPVSPVRVTIQPTPRRTQDLQPTPIGGGKERVFSDEACALLAAIRSRKSTADIVHRLSRPSTPIYQVESILYETLTLFQGSSDTLRMNWYIDAFALLIEVYRTRAQTGKAPDAEDLSVRWKFAQELCSVAACANAFEDARDGDQVDLEAVWPLIDLSKWLMDFTEVLMKECVLLRDDDSNADGAKVLKSVPPVFLHLLHPLAFRHLMSSLVAVKRFHDYLKRLNASAENAQIAKNVLLDTVQCSGLKMKELESSLLSVAEDINKLNGSF
ncbi:hypothetical protein EWM64_g293 [Hericium alpestre]|uniref:Uncharacterized protein n=1 Tax=Hericium alpestre TaxID=135208 RepID=A0A4Z0AAX1_9AGAM|nr:hypothetical protein EWM64_g293 [Hericium alpestre]